jgi:EAL domain-containing protein (putative c-di-GMP-specific phosphodiesterase class I)
VRELGASVRWDHPRRGIVSPAEFFALAEDTRLIVPLRCWVLSQACRDLRAWRKTYLWLRLNVNLSAQQLSQKSCDPINTLKVDRSFVAALGHEPESTAVVEMIIALSRALRIPVTAEGIETGEQAAQLQGLGCRKGQGHQYAQPVQAEHVTLGRLSGSAARAARPVRTRSCPSVAKRPAPDRPSRRARA